jgi:hypothetical protein
MITFNKPNALNGEQLRTELRLAGITISDETDAVIDSADGYIHLNIAAKDETKAATIVAAHNGNTVAPEQTIENKLASVGLNLDDLKTALGL